MIATIYPNLDEYEAQEEEKIQKINDSFLGHQTLFQSIEQGKQRQALAKPARGPRTKRIKRDERERPSHISETSTRHYQSRKREKELIPKRKEPEPPHPNNTTNNNHNNNTTNNNNNNNKPNKDFTVNQKKTSLFLV